MGLARAGQVPASGICRAEAGNLQGGGACQDGVTMNKLAIVTLASSLLLFTGGIAGAQTARARIADTPIRAEANLASPIIATLKEGGPVDVVNVEGEWCRVLVPNEQSKPQVGYVLANLIEILDANGSPQSISTRPTRSFRVDRWLTASKFRRRSPSSSEKETKRRNVY